MKITNRCKIMFDLIMLILLVLVYCAYPTGMVFHEYAGLAVYLLFILHLAYNRAWIINAGKRLFDKSLGIRLKCRYATAILLLIGFMLVGLSGVMISREVFKLGIMPVWRPMHSIASAVTAILLGLHIGLHGTMIVNTVKSRTKGAFPIVVLFSIVIVAASLILSIYGIILSKSANQAVPQQYTTAANLFERSLSLLKGPPEYVRNRQQSAPGGEGQVRNRPAQPQFNGFVLAVDFASYLVFIAVCGAVSYGATRKKPPREKRFLPRRS
ncbi:MAG: DUF4405 domain-containing protein [Spirochaetaceae bacterium]|jgi:hypothetical protein|nr:DUF4405 domain-containing protein [Spirochaetaceae bacterium]